MSARERRGTNRPNSPLRPASVFGPIHRLSMTSPRPHGAGTSSSAQETGLARESAIKKRIVRPKKLRRVDNGADALSSPGAGPSSPRRSASPNLERHSASRSMPEAQQMMHDTPTRTGRQSTRPPSCPHAPNRSLHPPLTSCRSVYNYTRLNHIEEGTYGVVFRAKCNATGEIYALKKLKLEEEKQGFPITSLREVMALMIGGRHENVVGIKEIVVGDTLNQ